MATKTVYFYKISLFDTKNSKEIPINNLKSMLEMIITANAKNNSISLSSNVGEQIFMDILNKHDEYLFVRLGKKRRNNSIQKRNYATLDAGPVLNPIEVASNGIEIFTYGIIGYKHGIMSIARAQGAPDEKFIQRLFTKYKNDTYLEIVSVPNNQLINELYDNEEAEINRITVEIPTPNAEILQKVLHAGDEELINSVQMKTETILFEVKPQKRGYILGDKDVVKKLIDAFKQSKDAFTKVVLDGKPNSNTRQRRYDLYEEYFKYSININETHMENGVMVEYSKEKVQNDYRLEMTNIYNRYKEYILAVCDRLEE